MPEVTVIADDLTGAADCAIAFTLAGLPTFVVLDERPSPAGAAVVSRDVDTRRLAEAEAAARALAAARQAFREGTRAVYRKIDSTLRGNVGVEIAATRRAAAEAFREPPLVVASTAFPPAGRVVRDGQVLVHGVPLERTEVWRDSGKRGPADLPSMLRAAGMAAAVVRSETVRASGDRLARELAALAAAGAQAAVCDAEDLDDLRRIARAGASLASPVVWAGSSGLSRELPAALGLRPPPASSTPALPAPRGPALVLVGSRSTVARDQARRLCAEPGVAALESSPAALLEGPGSAAWAALEAALRERLAAAKDVVLLLGLEPRLAPEAGPALAARFAALAASQAGAAGGIVATGGDVARAALGALGAGGVRLLGEVEPGVPLGVADAPRPLPIVTKAGGFGSPDALVRARAILKGGIPR